ncbi:hypothetical protein [Burkholderia pseudomultivorans]|uniref:hypothetical protein n=1 Tax=Burkholderia pseudomultivorans TaxID=1207504 RepID=UPI001E3C6AC4|nr:hypothetical protein [Burkholderia pseudomultivorans]
MPFFHRHAAFLHGVYAAPLNLEACRTAQTASVRAMTFIRPVPAFAVASRPRRSGARQPIVPAPFSRVLLPVTLSAHSPRVAHDRLAALLGSPLGVYVVGARIVRRVVHLHFDIAPEDLDFTLHTLIAQLADAVIGPVVRGPQAAARSR